MRKNGDEDEMVSRQFKEVIVFILEKAQEMSEQKARNFTVKVKGREPERISGSLREKVEHDLSMFQGRKDYLNLREEVIEKPPEEEPPTMGAGEPEEPPKPPKTSKSVKQVKAEAAEKANEIGNQAR